MEKKIVLVLVGLLLSSQMIYAGEIFSEDFTVDPGWISTEPTNVKWDPAGFYRARVTDNPSWFVQWGYSPLFQEVSDASFSLEFDVNPVAPSYGTYPGLHLIAEGVADPFANSSLGIWVANADEFPNNFVIQGIPYGGSPPIYFSSLQFTVGEWYHHRVDYDVGSGTLSWKISLVGMPDGSFHSNTYTDISVAPFNQVIVGYQSGSPVYGSWAEAYVDNIEIVPEPAGPPEPPGPVAYWSFDDAGNPGHDDSGNGHNGAVNGAVSTEGVCNNALSFDGVDDIVDFGNTIGNFGTADFSVVFWLRTDTDRWETVMGKRAFCGEHSFFELQMSWPGAPGDMYAELYEGFPSIHGSFNSNQRLDDNQWHLLAITRQGVQGKLYIDGVLDASRSAAKVINMSNSASFLMGNGPCYPVHSNFFSGKLDEVRIYDKALTATAIEELYDSCFDPHTSNAWKTERAILLLDFLSVAMGEGALTMSVLGIESLILQLYPVGGVLLVGQAILLGLDYELQQIVADPPDPNYDEVYIPQVPDIPLEGLEELSHETASFLQKRIDLRSKLLAYLKALLITMEREAGAREADDQAWLEIQQDAFGRYSRVVQSLIAEIALAEQDANSVLEELETPNSPLELSDIENFQQYLANHGLPEDELYILSLFGIEPNDVQEQIDAWVAIDPCELVGATVQDVFSEAEMFGQFLSVFPEPDNYIPIAYAGLDQSVECACNTSQGTKVTLDGTGSSDAEGDPLTYTWTGSFAESPASGATPTVTLLDGCPGDYVITLVVNDGIEDSEPDEAIVTVVDNTPPDFTLSVTPTMLWPPNHKMVLITANWTVSDDCDDSPEVMLVSITMNEGEETNTFDPTFDYTLGDGHTIDDIQVDSDGIWLRAERSGTGDGREYIITYRATDESGNYTERSATVTVPHNQP